MSFLRRFVQKVQCYIGWRMSQCTRAYQNKCCDQLQKRLKACGAGTILHHPVVISAPEQMSIGANMHVGANCYIRAEGGVEIGDNTHISRNLVLYSLNHRVRGAQRLPYDDQCEYAPVRIGDNVWIGMNVCIVPGTTIGDGAVIGMGTTVSGSVPPMSVVVGSKWRVVGERDREHYAALVRQGAFGGADGLPLMPIPNSKSEPGDLAV